MWKWTKRIGLGLVCFVAFLLLGGVAYQFISTKLDERAYPPLGQLVDVGGYKLHLNCSGEGSSTVVFDSGFGCNSLAWTLVQSEVSKFSRAVSYDRAGQGWSETSPQERTSQNIVDELHLALKSAKVPGPYILVGHSFGGINVLLYASRYPDEVAGVVLVDSSHEDVEEKFPPMPKPNLSVLSFLTRIGGTRLITHLSSYKKGLEVFPSNIQKMYLAKISTDRSVNSCLKEASVLDKSLNQLKSAGGNLGNKPLIVITAGKPMGEQASGLSEEIATQMTEAWTMLQKDLVTKSTNGKQIIAEHSGHMIPHEQPEIIVEAIREMVSSK